MREKHIQYQISGAWIGQTKTDNHYPRRFYKEHWSVSKLNDDGSYTYLYENLPSRSSAIETMEGFIHNMYSEDERQKFALVQLPRHRGPDCEDYLIIA